MSTIEILGIVAVLGTLGGVGIGFGLEELRGRAARRRAGRAAAYIVWAELKVAVALCATVVQRRSHSADPPVETGFPRSFDRISEIAGVLTVGELDALLDVITDAQALPTLLHNVQVGHRNDDALAELDGWVKAAGALEPVIRRALGVRDAGKRAHSLDPRWGFDAPSSPSGPWPHR